MTSDRQYAYSMEGLVPDNFTEIKGKLPVVYDQW